MSEILSHRHIVSQTKFVFIANDADATRAHAARMDEVANHYFREWRKHRKLTLDRVSELTGIDPGNLSRIERGKREWSSTTLSALAEAYGASKPLDLLSPPDRSRDVVPLAGLIGAGGGVERIENVVDHIPAPPGTVEPLEALRVTGGSMAPELQPGDVIFYAADFSGRPDAFLNRLAAVETEGGELAVKYLRRGSSPDVFDLYSHAEPLREDVSIKAASPVLFIKKVV